MRDHTYAARLEWTGSTGVGYRVYPRAHRASAAPASAQLELSADRAFRGDPTLLNPEQLVVMAASSCQLLSFLAVAAREDVVVLGYQDDAQGVMPLKADPMRITRITLRPRITVATDTPEDTVHRIAKQAHRECFIANTLTADIEIEVSVTWQDPYPTVG